ncbi:Carboxylesterase 5A [Blomia tropicalis]|nr:Carboxylesterase 5A [Blomia tropicalis]
MYVEQSVTNGYESTGQKRIMKKVDSQLTTKIWINSTRSIIIFLMCLSVIYLQSVQCHFVEVQTELGRIRGIRFRTQLNNPAIGFLGIPYALPPVGERRFKKPVSHPKWSPKTLMATSYKSCCPQLDMNGIAHGAEDCLYLNVFVPLHNIDQNQFSMGGKRFPVMVYMQGESFENGDAALYGAEKLLDWDVILVTFNYRLGVLGFFSTGDEHASGNWGLYDQLAVLRWVHEHIESFSGNPSSVTIIGQGAGK